MGSYNTADTVVRDRRQKYVMKEEYLDADTLRTRSLCISSLRSRISGLGSYRLQAVSSSRMYLSSAERSRGGNICFNRPLSSGNFNAAASALSLRIIAF